MASFIRVVWAPIFAPFATYFFLLFAQPPRDSPECAYFFLLPALAWFMFKPKRRIVLLSFFVAGFLYHVSLIGWMRHVAMPGMLSSSILLSIYNLPWFFLASVLIPWSLKGKFFHRLVSIFGLSFTWVAIEWARCQFTLGFPWCPLSVTQWERPVLLQTAQWFGGWIVSFFLVFFNLCLASYVHHLIIRRKNLKAGMFGNICPDFYLAILLFIFMISPFFMDREDSGTETKVLKIGICQPYLLEKWKGDNADLHKEILSRQTSFLGLMEPDLILWPEASTPYALNKDKLWVEELSKKTSTPLLVGSVLRDGGAVYNTISEILPNSGFQNNWYAKRTLVPFGEYVPFPFKWIPGLQKMVGPVGNFQSGNEIKTFSPFPNLGQKSIKIGPLICYEDIFPKLSREISLSGVDLFFVTTNNAWFGEEGCAEQHAAHSVLRAVETQKPFVRCGNAGWSGWIDSKGYQREVIRDENGSIYCDRATCFQVNLKGNHERNVSFYTKWGDWFAYVSAFVTLGLFYFCLSNRFKKKL